MLGLGLRIQFNELDENSAPATRRDARHYNLDSFHSSVGVAFALVAMRAPHSFRWDLPMLRPFIAFLSLLCLSFTAVHGDTPRLDKSEQSVGFESLFDGSTLQGWKNSGNWIVEEGVITRKGKGGSLVYSNAKVPDDFELRFEWKVAKGSNSGVYYRPGQYEYQVLDNAVHSDGKNPRTSAASLYFCLQPSEDATRSVGEWNEGRIVCKGTVIQHWLNGKKVIDFDYTDEKWGFNVEMLKARGGDLSSRGANLSFQDHGDPVWYRNIRMRTLASSDDIGHSDVEPATIADEILKSEKAKLDGIIGNRKKAKAT